MAQILTLAGQSIKQPTSFKIGSFNLTKAGRVATGDMTLEYIATKRKFYFEYDVLAGDELDIIKDIVTGSTMFFTLTYVDNGNAESATVYAGALEKEAFRNDGLWYWKEISFDLIEQ